MLLFSMDEYKARLFETKKRMNEKGLDALILADPANMNYLTGYDGWSFYVPQYVIVEKNADSPLWIGRGMDANGAKHTTWLSDDDIIGYPDDYVQNPVKHPMNYVAEKMSERGWGRGNVGVETDAYYFTARCYLEIVKSLNNAKIVDAHNLVNWIRLVKSDAEIAYMKKAGKIIEKVMQAAINKVAPGVRECDAVAEVYRTQVSGTESFGGDYPSIVPMMPSGEKTSTPHLTWTDEPYGNELAVNLELAACCHRYHSPMARTLYLGKNPPEKLVSTAEIVVDGLNKTLAAIKPGMACEEVELVWRNHISKHGLKKESRIGYPMGLNYPPDWGEHTCSLRPGDKTVLKPNMTFHMILGMWMDNWGFEASESLYVTENGCATFAEFPRKLFIKS